MRVALCFYGQPRDIEDGYKNISKFMIENSNVQFDVFYHTWFSKKSNVYEASKHREISEKTLIQDNQVIEKINSLYNPVKRLVEEPIVFDTSFIKNTISYPSHPYKQSNLNNVFSQFHSRGKCRDLLNDHIKDTNQKYDIVISSRFDFYNPININLETLDSARIHVCALHFPRKIIPDAFMIMPTQMYLNVFNVYHNFDKILDNHELANIVKQGGENLEFNPEELITSMIYYYDYSEQVFFNHQMPFFCKL